MEKHFQFADFVDEFKVTFVAVVETDGEYSSTGKWIPGAETDVQMEGIILPLSTDELRYGGNGTYTQMDRKIYTTKPLKEGQTIKFNGQSYTIDNEKDYSSYADVFIYYAKGVKE